MTESTTEAGASFNLLDEPWIPVRWLDGRFDEVSVRHCLADAHRVRVLGGEVPTQQVAVLRLLLAVLHRSLPVRDHPDEEWRTLWRAGHLDPGPVEDYLAAYRDRFDLLHPVTPFYQVAGLRTAKGEFTSLSRLVADVPAGEQYFTTRTWHSFDSMSYAEAARWVVHAQAFDPSGIKSGAVGDERVKGGKGYPIGVAWSGWLGLVVFEGANLFETLLLNLVLGSDDDGVDSAVWERDAQGPGVDERAGAPFGPADLLTWQSRRIRLAAAEGRVHGVLLCNGDPLHPRNQHRRELMTAWRRSEAQEKATGIERVFMPRAHLPDRAVWRGLSGLLGTAPEGETQSGLPPRTLTWLASLRQARALPPHHVVRARAVGVHYGAQNSVVDDLYDDALTVHAAVLADPELRAAAVNAVRNVDHAVRALGDLARNLTLAAGGDPAGAREAARETGFGEVDAAYRTWLAALDPDSDVGTARTRWQLELRARLEALAHLVVQDAGTPAWLGRVVREGSSTRMLNTAIAERFFRGALRKALPLAHPERRDEESA